MTSELDLAAEYDIRMPLYGLLANEVAFSIETRLKSEGIKVHSVSSRVKSVESFVEKVTRKSYTDPFTQTPDLVGVRVVCLFMSDLSKVCSVLESEFNVTKHEDKIHGGDVDSFGYMSIHYECSLGQSYSGPRYDDIKEVTFELQVRTIVMDAWANISHHLAYKGEASIPPALRRDFHALSGLFYVADQHFELFSRSSDSAEASVKQEFEHSVENSKMLDRAVLAEYLQRRYPERVAFGDTDAHFSELVEDLVGQGYATLGDIADLMDRAEQAVLKYEKDRPPSVLREPKRKRSSHTAGNFSLVGLARMALYFDDPSYRNSEATGRYAEYRKLVKPHAN